MMSIPQFRPWYLRCSPQPTPFTHRAILITLPCSALLPEGPSLALGMGVHGSSSGTPCRRQGKLGWGGGNTFYHRTNRRGEKSNGESSSYMA